VQVLETIPELRVHLEGRRRAGATVGFVPTMGYLHAGHLSLMQRSVADQDVTAVSIFVNPLQFAPTEDLASYPRDLERDLRLCDEAGVDVVFAPSVEEMYPEPMLTTVSVARLGAAMEGASRPDHFAGVSTVVAKLFGIVGACHAYFGEKDWQQLAIVTRMARDLAQPVVVVGCPIVREPDGLALSSRNVYLTEPQRAAAPVLHRALSAGLDAIGRGVRDRVEVESIMAGIVVREPLAQLDYVAAVGAHSLEPMEVLEGEVRLLAAARFGSPRLLDNVGTNVPPE